MNTKILMGASAIVLGLLGAAGLFLPHEILAALKVSGGSILPVMVQLHAAALLAFAMVNWTAKESLIGGIYGRAIGIGNLTHFTIGAIALVKAASAAPMLYGAAAVYGVFAVAFGVVFFGSPVRAGA
jgi:hypothetical protein